MKRKLMSQLWWTEATSVGKHAKCGLRGSSIDRSEVWTKTMSQSWWRLTKRSTIIVNTIQAYGVLDTGCLAQLKGSRGSVFLLKYPTAKQTLCMPLLKSTSCQVRI